MKIVPGMTYEAVILAADDGAGAGRAGANADDGDGRAGETDESIYTLDHNAEQAKDGSGILGGSLYVRENENCPPHINT